MHVNELEMTPLHIVCSCQQNGDKTQYMIYILLKSGADPNLTDIHGRSSVHFAAASGNVEALTYLCRNCVKGNNNS